MTIYLNEGRLRPKAGLLLNMEYGADCTMLSRVRTVTFVMKHHYKFKMADFLLDKGHGTKRPFFKSGVLC